MIAYGGYLFDRVADYRWACVLDLLHVTWEYHLKSNRFDLYSVPVPGMVFVGETIYGPPDFGAQRVPAISVFGDLEGSSNWMLQWRHSEDCWEAITIVDCLSEFFDRSWEEIAKALQIASSKIPEVCFV